MENAHSFNVKQFIKADCINIMLFKEIINTFYKAYDLLNNWNINWIFKKLMWSWGIKWILIKVWQTRQSGTVEKFKTI